MVREPLPAHLGSTAPWCALLCVLFGVLALVTACRKERLGGSSGSGQTSTPAGSATRPAPQPQPSAAGRGAPAVTSVPTAGAVVVVTADAGDEVAEVDDTVGVECPPKDPSLKPLQLLRYRFTSAVEHRDPTDKLYIARPGQRVWLHLRVRNRTGRDRCVHVAFSVNGEARTELDLEVGHSWSWRTWAYNTLRATDKAGRLEVTVTDDQGRLLLKEHLPIVPESATK